MSEPAIYPYGLLIIPPKSKGGSYQWAIQMHGKLVQRSDRNFPSEAKARAHAMEQIDKLLSGQGDR